jgi:hypothetical protein
LKSKTISPPRADRSQNRSDGSGSLRSIGDRDSEVIKSSCFRDP